jgi:hypothetical protein
MFDSLVADTAGARGAGAVGAWARVEAAACARRLAAMLTMLDAAYAADGSADRDQWCLDNWGAVCAHIGAAQRLTSGAASALLLIAVALRDRFPQVAALLGAGLIDYPLARTIVSRGALIRDPDALRQLDEALAAALRCWEPMSLDKTIHALDAFIAGIDPHAVRRTRTGTQGRSVTAALADFIRARDLTCRFPGCTVPATNCDVEHTIPWPYGPTSASNPKMPVPHQPPAQAVLGRARRLAGASTARRHGNSSGTHPQLD